MTGLTTESYKRPTDLSDKGDPEVRFSRSYLRIRLAIGFMGVFLPVLMWFLEGPLLKGSWQLRDSLSAYYHTGARDLFVGVLCIVGFLLITYVVGTLRSWDFVLSLVAGIALLGVALLPTKRGVSGPKCGELPVPEGCSRVQQVFGEELIGNLHLASAAIFIASLAFLCFLFARREKRHLDESGHGMRHVVFHAVCGSIIVAAGAWAVLGVDFRTASWSLTALYVGEVLSILAFGASWIGKGFDLLKQLAKEATRVFRAIA